MVLSAELDLLGEAAARLAQVLARETLARMLDGRLATDVSSEALDERYRELEAACAIRSALLRAAYPAHAVCAGLVQELELDELDLDLLTLAAAGQLDPPLAQALAALRPPGAEAGMHVGLLATLATETRTERATALARFEAHASLRRWNLVECPGEGPLLGRPVVVPEHALALLRGDGAGAIEASLRPALRVVTSAADLPMGSASGAIALVAAALASRRPTVIVMTDIELGARATAQRCRPLEALSLALLPSAPRELAAALRSVVRVVRLRRAVLALRDLDQLGDEADPRLAMIAAILADLSYHEPLLAITERRRSWDELERDVVVVEVPALTPAERAEYLRGAVAYELADHAPSLATRLGNAQIDAAAFRYPLAPRRLEAAARTAVRTALARSAVDPRTSLDAADLASAMRSQLDHQMSSLADRVRTRVRFDDLVVEPEILERLREVLVYVRCAGQVYDRWGFGSRVAARGIAALFSGPPGTGKTMAASVLAGELGLELFRIDLSRVVSKYIGETESNLARVFSEASTSRAILLFDEADSLFGKRTEVKSSVDRYANMEVNYLLQRMESFDGISILTTNHDHAMDDAFKRRLQFRLRFEAPDEQMRAALWNKLLPAEADCSDDVDLAELGVRFEMSGGHIRNAAVRAAFVAAGRGVAIGQRLLVQAAERELEESGTVVVRR